ncbi:hypothetical protein [Frigidibacter sp. ROC022]|uniref:hypothetical protein n=1 Tax=Frigidibacter sp. ROC022 TaxID=2971796 RepID=UPI00215A9CF8|nr:hypothetical protein [Frigidibacter sp. ROC022]MCR8724957.1 hypothetical protein [Frigidibacter sp. ROC022]
MIRRLLLALPLVLLGWIGVMAGVMLVSDAAPGAVVLFPSPHLLERMPDAAVLGRGRFWIALQSPQEDFGRALYGAGALLVLPAGLTGCLPLPAGAGGG